MPFLFDAIQSVGRYEIHASHIWS